ncbi:MAG: hypothetical protein GY874_05770 [Desulfobacteraceae bacterium]|nr:hypothetical protein [Desulfobacteraceae bacterium]
MDNRLKHFYYEKCDGEYKNFLNSISCLHRSGLEICGYQHVKIDTPFLLNIADINFFLGCNSDGTINTIGLLDAALNSQVFNPIIYKEKNHTNFEYIANLLDSGEMIVLETDQFRLPFLIFFTGKKEFSFSHHALLVVGHDSDNFFFVEPPWHVNEKFIPHPKNKGIGIVPKKLIKELAGEEIVYYLIKSKNNGNFDAKNHLQITINDCTQNYYHSYKKGELIGNNEFTIKLIEKFLATRMENLKDNADALFTGKDAVQKLTEIICDLEIPLNELFYPHPDKNREALFDLWVGGIVGKRYLLANALEEYSMIYNINFKPDLFNSLEENLSTWRIILAVVRKNLMTKTYKIESSLKYWFGKLKATEDNLIKQLSNIDLN